MRITGSDLLSKTILAAIQAEATRREAGTHSMTDPDCDDRDRLAILMAGTGQVAQELIYDGERLVPGSPEHRNRLAGRLVEIAAMAGAWAEYMEGGD